MGASLQYVQYLAGPKFDHEENDPFKTNFPPVGLTVYFMGQIE